MKKLLYLTLFILFSAPLAAQNHAGDSTHRMERRPRFAFDAAQPFIHDPVMAREGGVWHLFYTGMGIGHYISTDGKVWAFAPSVFKQGPQWAVEAIPGFRGHIWAPDVLYYRGKYHLFYSCSAFARNTSAIGHAVSSTLNPDSSLYGWHDTGLLLQSVPSRDDWNAIDPNVVVDEEGVPWMCFGSFWDGIKMVRLNETLDSVAQPQEWVHLARRMRVTDFGAGSPGSNAVEAPFIFKHGGYYYLFVSFDYCCRGLKRDYKIAVGRSRKVTGPYVDRANRPMSEGGGTIIATGNDRWAGVGHCAVYHVDDSDVLVAHGYDKKDEGQSKLIMVTLGWDSEEWPVVKL